ncbi:helix-turn-helix domain-containing protein [Halorientalis halophila]|uniref:helix-turn-helix domain-containing protein n=1 Tax=Halorientalis halophila TaxID=3108499 RepID=UPI0030092697
MAEGILATVAVREPDCCPVAPMSTGGRVRSVSQSRPVDGTVTVEVTTDATVEGSDVPGETLFSYDSETVHRLERQAGQNCACELVERHGCPVRDVSAEGGSVVLSFIAEDLAVLRDVVADLREREEGVTVRSLRRSGEDGSRSEPVFVDKGEFTPRQREVLRTAHEAGYFERPKGANAEEVAAALEVAPSTFAEHLAAAQTKLMAALFGGAADES